MEWGRRAVAGTKDPRPRLPEGLQGLKSPSSRLDQEQEYMAMSSFISKNQICRNIEIKVK